MLLQSASNAILKVDVADPPEDTATLVGLNVVVTPDGAVADKLTVHENPPVLVTLIVEMNLPPATGSPKLEGLAVMVKSPVA